MVEPKITGNSRRKYRRKFYNSGVEFRADFKDAVHCKVKKGHFFYCYVEAVDIQ